MAVFLTRRCWQHPYQPGGIDSSAELVARGNATLASQGLHACCGYWTSRLGVFQRRGKPWAYAAIVIMSWLMQWQALHLILELGLGKTWAVALLIAPLAAFSYLLQRRLVFR